MGRADQSQQSFVRPRAGIEPVAFDFAGEFVDGSFAGTAFSGQISYDPSAAASERHISFAMYERWTKPIVTIAVGGKIMTADGAAVYDSIFDGTAAHHDFVTMYNTDRSDQGEVSDGFEFYFADQDALTLDGTRMPSADQLCNFPIKQVSYWTDAPGNVISVGKLRLSRPGQSPA